MKLIKNKHYLVHQKFTWGASKMDYHIVVKYMRKATKVENEAYYGNDGHFGRDVKDNEVKYFEYDEVISSITI